MNFSRSRNKIERIDAFSLAEVLIVLAIMGILIMLVVPNQTGIASRAKSMEAQQELRMIHNLQYAHHLQYSKYTMDLKEVNYVPHKLLTEGGTALYRITILESTPSSFKARAEAVQDFNGDGKFNIWEIDQEGNPKEVQPD